MMHAPLRPLPAGRTTIPFPRAPRPPPAATRPSLSPAGGSGSSFGAGVGSLSGAGEAVGAPDGKATPRRRSRGGRGRRRKGASEATPPTPDRAAEADRSGASDTRAEEPPTDGEAPRRRSRRRARTHKRPAEERAAEQSAASDVERPARRKRSPRVVTTKTQRRPKATGTGSDQDADGAAPKRSRRAARTPKAGDSEAKAARRRRGRGKSAAAPVEVDWLPGEEDELPPELDPRPSDGRDEGDESEGRKGRRSRKRGKKGAAKKGAAKKDAAKKDAAKKDAGDSSKGSTAKEKAKKAKKKEAAAEETPNLILVNAMDAEETRVAVLEGELITEFQMTVKKHKSFVNDIYRGKVVNLEPAIGAAFVDFGQGRNGFLHTSDVLSAYGEKDWSLDKLLTTRVDPEEWEAATDRNADLDVADGEEGGGRRVDHPHEVVLVEADGRGLPGQATVHEIRRVAHQRLPEHELHRVARLGRRERLLVADHLGEGGPQGGGVLRGDAPHVGFRNAGVVGLPEEMVALERPERADPYRQRRHNARVAGDEHVSRG